MPYCSRLLTNSGLSEMDAATVENVKWMMTYLNDCKASNVGQLFMAVQTYVWDHQSYKGEPGGDGDAGGYANADTYELYLSLIDSLLAAESSRRMPSSSVRSKSTLRRALPHPSWRMRVQDGRCMRSPATAKISHSSTIMVRASS